MKILILEPYFTGSHKRWAEGYKKYSNQFIKQVEMTNDLIENIRNDLRKDSLKDFKIKDK